MSSSNKSFNMDTPEAFIEQALSGYDNNRPQEALKLAKKGLKTYFAYPLYFVRGLMMDSKADIQKGFSAFNCVDYGSEKLKLRTIFYARKNFFPVDAKNTGEEQTMAELESRVKAKDATVLPLLNRAIQQSPFNSQLYLLHAELNDNNLELATIACALAFWNDPTNVVSLFQLIKIHLRRGELAIADRCIDQGLRNVAYNQVLMSMQLKMYSVVLLEIGTRFYGLQRYAIAEQYVSRALEIKTEDKANTYFIRGLIRECKGNRRGAEKDFNNAHKAEPSRDDFKEKFDEYFYASGQHKKSEPKVAKPKAATTPAQAIAAIRGALQKDSVYATAAAGTTPNFYTEELKVTAMAKEPAPLKMTVTVVPILPEAAAPLVPIQNAVPLTSHVATAAAGSAVAANDANSAKAEMNLNQSTSSITAQLVEAQRLSRAAQPVMDAPLEGSTALSNHVQTVRSSTTMNHTMWAHTSLLRFCDHPVLLHPTMLTHFVSQNGGWLTFYPLPFRVQEPHHEVVPIPGYMSLLCRGY